MRVEHLNAARITLPLSEPLVCHILLVHGPEGLVLVDTGFGLLDRTSRRGRERLGIARHVIRFDQDDSTTALRQLQARGNSAGDVQHIVLTHLDLDHVGGIADFPDARVHTTAEEYAAAMHPDWRDRQRYRHRQWDHGPRFCQHDGPGEPWRFGLTAHEVVPGVALIPMPGHTKGHAAVAVDAGDRGTLLHAGDAAFDASVYASATPSGEALRRQPVLRVFEQTMQRDRRAVTRNHQTLARLDAEDDVTVIPAHDARVFRALAPSAP